MQAIAALPGPAPDVDVRADAPAWWVLADAEGNEACIATVRGRP